MQEPRRFPTPKLILFGIHRDLAKITQPSNWFSNGDLSDLEVLVLLLEDRRFFLHQGIDLRSIARETVRMLTFRRFGGASTIDMQYVRTRTGYKARTARRKLYEMLLAYLLQFRMTKKAILRAYMQDVYLGSGLHGIYAASFSVFDKQIDDLSREEAAMIAAMMVYPRPQSPTSQWKERVNRRARYGLRLFTTLGRRYEQGFK
jgi:membrane peptidoglycan carboxypeptidase